MVAWKRFPIPEFDHEQYQDMPWNAPSLEDVAAVGSQPGATAVKLDSAIADRFGFSGEHLHAVACNLPAGGAHLLGRSHAWKIQRMLLLNAGNGEVVADWKTPRPMNTRLGPEDGIDLPAGTYLAVCGHKYADGWIGSRSIVQNGLSLDDGSIGFRVLAASDDELDDFNHVCLTFSWKA